MNGKVFAATIVTAAAMVAWPASALAFDTGEATPVAAASDSGSSSGGMSDPKGQASTSGTTPADSASSPDTRVAAAPDTTGTSSSADSSETRPGPYSPSDGAGWSQEIPQSASDTDYEASLSANLFPVGIALGVGAGEVAAFAGFGEPIVAGIDLGVDLAWEAAMQALEHSPSADKSNNSGTDAPATGDAPAQGADNADDNTQPDENASQDDSSSSSSQDDSSSSSSSQDDASSSSSSQDDSSSSSSSSDSSSSSSDGTGSATDDGNQCSGSCGSGGGEMGNPDAGGGDGPSGDETSAPWEGKILNTPVDAEQALESLDSGPQVDENIVTAPLGKGVDAEQVDKQQPVTQDPGGEGIVLNLAGVEAHGSSAATTSTDGWGDKPVTMAQSVAAPRMTVGSATFWGGLTR